MKDLKINRTFTTKQNSDNDERSKKITSEIDLESFEKELIEAIKDSTKNITDLQS